MQGRLSQNEEVEAKTRMNVNSFQDRENAQALPSNRPSIAKQ